MRALKSLLSRHTNMQTKRGEGMDAKIVIALFADILYMKGIICFEELDAIFDIRNEQDVQAFTERLLRGEFNVYKRGEHYITAE